VSIYASIPGIDDEAPCGPPWVYQGSHVLPDEDDPRGGSIGLAPPRREHRTGPDPWSHHP